jgi:uncharacterized NAD-dependent epimerase/dehydratase family protein
MSLPTATPEVGDHPGVGRDARFLVLAEGLLADVHGKLAHGVLRFRPEAVVAVVDSTHAGATADVVAPDFTPVPIVESLEAGTRHGPTALLLGATPGGGRLPASWRPFVLDAIERGLDVVSGMHTFLDEDQEFAAAAEAAGVALVDLRRPPDDLELASGRVLDLLDTRVVLTVGSDAAVGKMTTSLLLTAALRAAGRSAAFVATGQTGIAIAGWGVAIDRVIGDFMAGVTEDLVLRAARDADIVVVEGQGGIAHPAYSSVTLGLLHGAAPTDLVLCHDASRSSIRQYERRPVPPLHDLIATYEDLARYTRPASVCAVAVNTYGMSADDARRAIDVVAHETGLPAVDPVRQGADVLGRALVGPRP